MNKSEFKAIMMIAEKLGWKSVNFKTIQKMVMNQQSLMLDTVGECDSFEDELLTLAIQPKDKIISRLYISSYEDLVMWNVECFCEDMGITRDDFRYMLDWHACKMDFLVPEYEIEQEHMEWDPEEDKYYEFMAQELAWYNHARMMGWE